MATQRLCRQCHDPLGIDDDRCQTCGASNPLVLPWYTYPVGFLMMAAIAYFLIDWSALLAFVTGQR